MPSELVIDCSGQAEPQVNEIADEVVAERLGGLAEANQRRDAAVADRKAALSALRAKGKTDANVALIARALGVDPNAPDPTRPPAA